MTQHVRSYLNNKRLSGGAAADDGFRDIVTLSSSLVVQHGSSDGCRSGELNYPVAIEVVLTTQILDSYRYAERLQSRKQSNLRQTYVQTLILTKVVACGHCLSDADGGGSNRDDEHLVVA